MLSQDYILSLLDPRIVLNDEDRSMLVVQPVEDNVIQVIILAIIAGRVS